MKHVKKNLLFVYKLVIYGVKSNLWYIHRTNVVVYNLAVKIGCEKQRLELKILDQIWSKLYCVLCL